MNLPKVKENETLQEYIRRAISEGVASTSVPQLIINFNKK